MVNTKYTSEQQIFLEFMNSKHPSDYFAYVIQKKHSDSLSAFKYYFEAEIYPLYRITTKRNQNLIRTSLISSTLYLLQSHKAESLFVGYQLIVLFSDSDCLIPIINEDLLQYAKYLIYLKLDLIENPIRKKTLAKWSIPQKKERNIDYNGNN